MNEIGDEMHLVFEYPGVQEVRDQYAHLFTFSTSTMRTFLWQDNIIFVIKLKYVVACMDDTDSDRQTFNVSMRTVIKHM